MIPLRDMPGGDAGRIDVLFADIDDTVTTGGRLTAEAYAAMEALDRGGVRVVPVTGRPAGWCDHIARMWPVAAVVGENGAFWFRYDREARRMRRRHWRDAATRRADRERLDALAGRILEAVPGAAIAADQDYREADLAIDWCEDVPALSPGAVARIVSLFEAAGARAKVSSIHVNGWFGDYDKLAMTRLAAGECLGVDLDAEAARCAFVGDSPNDAPMFAFFTNAVGVANVRDFEGTLDAAPRYVTDAPAGAGFRELASKLLGSRA